MREGARRQGGRSRRQEQESRARQAFELPEEGGYSGYVAEIPGANTQGETLEEARENLSEAIQLILEANREEFERKFTPTAKVTRERLVLAQRKFRISDWGFRN
ncbi:MAG: type II toxin-antitoxin system HicB family antitoxin [Pyrinomonadaceae bacterium]|nr:type II toxin-antitoxin system HicB family antitoxin [Pyrinomonadaceae bacterium]